MTARDPLLTGRPTALELAQAAPASAAARVLVKVLDLPHMGVRTVAAVNVYTCPREVPADAKTVPIEGVIPLGTGPFRVGVGTRRRPVLARARPRPEVGERVLCFLISFDLLSLFVAEVQAPGSATATR